MSQKTFVETDTQLQVQPASPLQIIQGAIQAGVTPETLEKLLDFQERLERNQAEKTYNEAMAAAQESMPVVVKDATNTQTRSKYALYETIQHQCKPIWQKHGFSLSFGEAECPTEGMKRTTCDVLHIAGATHHYHLDLPVDGIGPKGNPIGGMNAVQGHISSGSYAARVLTCMIFNITVAGEDMDGSTPREMLTPEEIQEINAALKRIPPGDDELAKQAMLDWAGVTAINEIARSKFADAMKALKKRAAP